MKKDQIKLGATYSAKVSDKLATVRIDGDNPHGGWDATNLATGKKVRIKSAQRLRAPASWATPATTPATKAPKANAATKTKAAPAKRVKQPSAKKVSGLDLAAKVLAQAKEPLDAKDIAERVIAAGWKTKGATPQATIYAAIGREIAAKGKDARFRKTGRGLFTTSGKGA